MPHVQLGFRLVVAAECRREVEVEEAFGENDSRREEGEAFDESDSRRARENCPSSIARCGNAGELRDGELNFSCSGVNVFAWIHSGA